MKDVILSCYSSDRVLFVLVTLTPKVIRPMDKTRGPKSVYR